MTSSSALSDSPVFRLRAESPDAVCVLLAGISQQVEHQLRERCYRLEEIEIDLRSRYVDNLSVSAIDLDQYDAIVFGEHQGAEQNNDLLSKLQALKRKPSAVLLGSVEQIFQNKVHCTPTGFHVLSDDCLVDELLLAILKIASLEELDDTPAEIADWNLPTPKEGIVIIDAADRIIFANQQARRRTRRELGRMIDIVCSQGWPNNDLPTGGENFTPVSSDVRSTYIEWEGDRYTLVRLNSPLLRIAEPQGGYAGRIEQTTGLPDREMFATMCSDALTEANDSENNSAALLLISLDKLPMLRGMLSETGYTAMLHDYSARLRKELRSDDYLACLGAQEFGVLLHGTSNSEGIADIAEKISNSLEAELNVMDEEVRTSVSIGISLYPHDGRRVEELLRCSDLALHRARQNNESVYEFYDPEISLSFRERLVFERRLRRALPEERYELHYQPIVLPDCNLIVGAEALLRLNDTDTTVTMPSVFIPILEETGLIVDVGRWAIQSACEQLHKWHEMGFPDFYISVNISTRQFEDEGLADHILRCLDTYGVPPSSLILEITESLIMSDSDRAIRVLSYLREYGVNTVIDDFGTGYSSLAYLKRLPVAGLKIDRGFVRNLPDDNQDAAITLSLIDLARHMGLWVVAEGIEEHAQQEFLVKHGIELMQGFLFYRPLQAEKLGAIICEQMQPDD